MAGADPSPGEPRNARVVAALDVGSSKIACLIAVCPARPGADQPVDVIGVGRQALRHGAGPSDPLTLDRPVIAALEQARRMAGDVEAPVGVAYGGEDLASTVSEGAVRLRRGAVGVADVAAAIGQATARLGEDRRLLHAAPLTYRIDGGDPVCDPRGLAGDSLTAEVCLVHAQEVRVAALEVLLQRVGVRPAFLSAAPVSAGRGVLSAEELEAGAVVVELGEHAASIAVFRNGGLVHADSAAGCGARLTADLAARLGTTFAVAERAKLQHGGLTGEHDPREAVEVPVIGSDGRLETGVALRSAFTEALRPRLEEILERVGARLDALGTRAEGLGVALTGGTSQIGGLRVIAQQILRRPTRIATPTGFAALDGQAGRYAVCAGLLRQGLDRIAEAAPRPRVSPQPAAVAAAPVRRSFGDAVAWIKENF